MNSPGAQPVGLAAVREGVAALRARVWLLVALAVVGLLAGFLISSAGGEDGYRIWLSAQALGANRAVTEIGISTPEGPQAADFLDERVIRSLERSTGHSYDYLVGHLSLEQPPTGAPNPPIALIAKAGDAGTARALLSSWLATIHEVRAAQVARVLARTERRLRQNLSRAGRLGRPATAAAMAERLARLEALRATLGVDYAITTRARKLTLGGASLSSVVAGGLGGLIAGLALALLLALLDGVVRTREGIEAATGLAPLADLSTSGGLPSGEHARERLRALNGGSLPPELLLVPCGDVEVAGAASTLSGALGEGVEVRAATPVGETGALAEIRQAPAWAVVASPGRVRRREVAALGSELAGIGTEPAGLLIV